MWLANAPRLCGARAILGELSAHAAQEYGSLILHVDGPPRAAIGSCGEPSMEANGYRRTDRAIAGIVLAGGRSARLAPANKLLLEAGGQALIRRAASGALAAELAPVVIVTGHERAPIEQAV